MAGILLKQVPGRVAAGASPSPASHPFLPIPVFLGLVLAILCTYGFSLNNAFVYDDGLVIADNLFIRDIAHAKDLFMPAYFSGSGESSYRPVVTFSYMSDYALFGLARWGYRAHGMLLHLAVAMAFLWLLAGLGLRGAPAWIATGLVALHPVAVESVVCPANREELYCALFILLSLGLLIRNRNAGWACAFFAMALLSKETAMALPVLWAAHHWISGRDVPQGDILYARRTQNGARVAGALCAVLGAYTVTRFVLMHNALEQAMSYRGGSLLSSLYAHAGGWLRMLRLFVAPVDLNVDPGLLQGSALAAGVAVAALLAVAWLVMDQSGLMAFGLFWIVAAYAPAAGFFPIANVFAERFLYMPLLGLGIFVAALGDALRRQLGMTSAVAAVSAVIVLGLMSQARAFVWKDGETLWADALQKNPASPRAHNNLGTALFAKGMIDAAQREFAAAVELDPRMSHAWANVADCHGARGAFDKTVTCYERALVLDEAQPAIHRDYADVLYKTGGMAQAEQHYRRALRLRPHYAEVLNNLGILLFKTGRMQEARVYLEKALEEIPEYPDALCNLGAVVAQQGDMTRAIVFWKRVLAINPYHAGARSNLKQAMGRLMETKQ